jgi:hypothetical protein
MDGRVREMASQATAGRATGRGAPPHIGGGTGANPGRSITMARTHELIDNFNDNLTDTTKWVPFGRVQEINQQLEIRPASNTAQSSGGYVSLLSYDLIQT